MLAKSVTLTLDPPYVAAPTRPARDRLARLTQVGVDRPSFVPSVLEAEAVRPSRRQLPPPAQ